MRSDRQSRLEAYRRSGRYALTLNRGANDLERCEETVAQTQFFPRQIAITQRIVVLLASAIFLALALCRIIIAHLQHSLAPRPLYDHNRFRSMNGRKPYNSCTYMPGLADTGPKTARMTLLDMAFMSANASLNDFGAVYWGRGWQVGGDKPTDGKPLETVFWRIDAYDRNLRFYSEDPADPAVTRRVLTIMLTSDC